MKDLLSKSFNEPWMWRQIWNTDYSNNCNVCCFDQYLYAISIFKRVSLANVSSQGCDFDFYFFEISLLSINLSRLLTIKKCRQLFFCLYSSPTPCLVSFKGVSRIFQVCFFDALCFIDASRMLRWYFEDAIKKTCFIRPTSKLCIWHILARTSSLCIYYYHNYIGDLGTFYSAMHEEYCQMVGEYIKRKQFFVLHTFTILLLISQDLLCKCIGILTL